MVQYLGRHIERRPHNRFEDRAIAIIEIAGKAEVTDLQLAATDQNIRRF